MLRFMDYLDDKGKLAVTAFLTSSAVITPEQAEACGLASIKAAENVVAQANRLNQTALGIVLRQERLGQFDTHSIFKCIGAPRDLVFTIADNERNKDPNVVLAALRRMTNRSAVGELEAIGKTVLLDALMNRLKELDPAAAAHAESEQRRRIAEAGAPSATLANVPKTEVIDVEPVVESVNRSDIHASMRLTTEQAKKMRDFTGTLILRTNPRATNVPAFRQADLEARAALICADPKALIGCRFELTLPEAEWVRAGKAGGLAITAPGVR